MSKKNLIKYIRSTFNINVNIDAKVFRDGASLNLLNKRIYKIYFEPIKYPDFRQFHNQYKSLAVKAFSTWSKATDYNITFKIVEKEYQADLLIFFSTSSIKAIGVSYTEHIATYGGSIKGKECIAIAIRDAKNNPSDFNTVYHVLLHEIGHFFGLGHSDDPQDVMSTKGFPLELSKNDLFVLKLIYFIGPGISYKQAQKYVEACVDNFLETNNTQFEEPNFIPEFCEEDFLLEETNQQEEPPKIENKNYQKTENLTDNLNKISDIKKYQITLQNMNIKVDYPKP